MGVLRFHHLVTDGLGFTIMLKHVAGQYSALVTGKEDDQIRYGEYEQEILNSLQVIGSATYEKDAQYWKEKFAQIPDPLLRKHSNLSLKQGNGSVSIELSEKQRSLLGPAAINYSSSGYLLWINPGQQRDGVWYSPP